MKILNPDRGVSPAKALARAGLIAAMYVALTLITPFTLSFGPFQFRIAEALMLMPLLTPDAIPGLFVGCLMANLLGGGVWFDVALGELGACYLLGLPLYYALRRLPENVFN